MSNLSMEFKMFKMDAERDCIYKKALQTYVEFIDNESLEAQRNIVEFSIEEAMLKAITHTREKYRILPI